jgi:hypothetical protein
MTLGYFESVVLAGAPAAGVDGLPLSDFSPLGFVQPTIPPKSPNATAIDNAIWLSFMTVPYDSRLFEINENSDCKTPPTSPASAPRPTPRGLSGACCREPILAVGPARALSATLSTLGGHAGSA